MKIYFLVRLQAENYIYFPQQFLILGSKNASLRRKKFKTVKKALFEGKCDLGLFVWMKRMRCGQNQFLKRRSPSGFPGPAIAHSRKQSHAVIKRRNLIDVNLTLNWRVKICSAAGYRRLYRRGGAPMGGNWGGRAHNAAAPGPATPM